MSDEHIAFLEALGRGVSEEERLILCGFRGDPATVGPTAWRPRPWRLKRDVPFDAPDNVYVAVAAFGKALDGSYRRRVDTFRAGLALMVDDVGTKVDRDVVSHLKPSARVETSPGNEQWWYFLKEPCRDVSTFDAVIRAFISSNLLGADPGMSGVNRVGRLPGFTNGKPKYKGWRCVLQSLEPKRRYGIDELVDAFRLTLNGRRHMDREQLIVPEEQAERVRAFRATFETLRQDKMVKRDEFDPSGWIEVRCPWIDNHTGRADTGAAVRLPNEENGWYGAFRCHHGHCVDMGWADLAEAVSGDAWEAIERINKQAQGL